MTSEGTQTVRARVVVAQASVVGIIAIAIAGVLLAVWNARWHEPFAYEGDSIFYAMVIKTIGRYGTYLENPHLGWPFGQNLADFPEGADNLNWFLLAAGQFLTGSAFTAMNLFYLASFGAVAGMAHAVLRLLGVRMSLAAATSLLFAFLPYHFARNEVHLQLSMYFMVPVAVLIALLMLSDDPPLTQRTDDGGWRFAWRSRRTWLVLASVALLASGGAYYFAFSLLLFAAAAVARALSGGGWRPIAACSVLIVVGAGVFALNVAPSIVERIRHGTPVGVGIRTPTETELYGLRISQLYAPREDHRIDALARLADDSRGTIVPSENGQQLGVIGAGGLSLIVVLFVISALMRSSGGWRGRPTGRLLVGLGFLAVISMLVGAISSYSLLLSAVGLREIRAWNRITVVIAFCALAAVAVVADRLVVWLEARRPSSARFAAAGIAVVLLAVGLFDQTSPADRPDYEGIHRRFTSDETFFRTVADRLPAGTPVFELPHVPFPEVGPVHRTAAYDQARGFLFEPQLAWSFGFIRGRHPEYPLAFEGRPAQDWLTDLVAVGFRGLVIDRHGYADGAVALQEEVAAVLDQPIVESRDGRYGFFDLSAYARDVRRALGRDELAVRAEETLARGPLGPPLANVSPGH